jgi:hypothetical protein
MSTPEIHQWTNGGDRVFIVKIVGKDGKTRNGFQWPLTIGETVRPDTFSPDKTCSSGGLFGWPWGLHLGDGKEVNSTGLWLVFSSKPENVIGNVEGSKCKAREARIEFVGAQAEAMRFTMAGRLAWIQERSSGSASATGGNGSASATGYSGSASATGVSGSASATGDRGSASATGGNGSASATGDNGSASATGDRGSASATGYSGSASATGDSGSASATGDSGSASATGDSGSASATGDNSIAFTTGIDGRVAGKKGIWLVASEWKETDGKWHRVRVKTVRVDGKKIKEDTFYKIVKGKWVEA